MISTKWPFLTEIWKIIEKTFPKSAQPPSKTVPNQSKNDPKPQKFDEKSQDASRSLKQYEKLRKMNQHKLQEQKKPSQNRPNPLPKPSPTHQNRSQTPKIWWKRRGCRQKPETMRKSAKMQPTWAQKSSQSKKYSGLGGIREALPRLLRSCNMSKTRPNYPYELLLRLSKPLDKLV